MFGKSEQCGKKLDKKEGCSGERERKGGILKIYKERTNRQSRLDRQEWFRQYTTDRTRKDRPDYTSRHDKHNSDHQKTRPAMIRQVNSDNQTRPDQIILADTKNRRPTTRQTRPDRWTEIIRDNKKNSNVYTSMLFAGGLVNHS